MLKLRTYILTTTTLAGVVLLASPAAAQATQPVVQDQAAPPAAGGQPSGPVEAVATPATNADAAPPEPTTIVVTGTRIPQLNVRSAAPVTLVSDQDIKLSGATRIDDVLNQLPSASATQGPGLPNPSTGTAEIDLRYLGAKRTLTLVNGRRLAPGDPNQGGSEAGDINLIPASILKRVEVLTGGASSVYGADAVAGVVNFIVDTNFTGLQLDGQISTYEHNNNCPGISGGQTVCTALNTAGDAYPKGTSWDGRAIDATVKFGAGFDDGRGHLMGYFGYRKQDPILQGDRDYSACTLNGSATPACGGSSFSAEGNFLLTDGFYTRGPDGTIVPGRTKYNFAPLNHWIRPDQRYVGGLFANYEVNRQIKPYLEFMYMDDKTVAQIAPSGNFGNTFSINCDNPYLSAQAKGVICAPANLISSFVGSFPLTGTGAPLNFVDSSGKSYQEGFFQVFRRNVEGGARQANFSHTTFRGVLGTKGDLSDAFSYDAYYQYGKTKYLQVFKNDISLTRLNRSVNVVLDPRPGSASFGQPVCRSVLDNSDPTCVPYNYLGTPSQAAVNYLNVDGIDPGETSEQVANVNFTGKLGALGLTSPWASDGIGFNAGWEYRKESLELNPDLEFQTGDLTGQGAPILPVNGSFHVNELFGEIELPVVQHNFIEDLSFSAGYRKSWYKTSAGRSYDTDTFKVSGEFAPVADIRFRASYNRAVRAPNLLELSTTPHVALDGSTDPCTDHVIAANEYGCIAQGLHAGQTTPSNPSEQYNGMVGGNPNLLPERATTKTIGVVLQPRFIPGFALTVDYWNIRLKGAIQGFGADSILADCIGNSTAAKVAASCSLIHRDASGSLWLVPSGPGAGYVNDLPTNVGGLKTDGIDVNASYAHHLGGLGGLSATFLGTYLRKYVTDNGIAQPYDCAGYYGSTCSGGAVSSSSVMPRWRHSARVSLQLPVGLGLSLNWRHVGPVKFQNLSSDQALSGPPNQLNSRVKAQEYFDLAASYTLFHSANLRIGVNNLFDKTPPIIPTANGSCSGVSCAGNTYPQTWDYLGRYLYAAFTIDFRHKSTPAPQPVVLAPPPPPPPAAPPTQTCTDGSVILATDSCPVIAPPAPPPPPPPSSGERG